MTRRWSLLVWFLLVTGACFDPRYPEGLVCGEAMTCPPGQTCDSTTRLCRIDLPAPMPPDAAFGSPVDAAPAPEPDAASAACANDPCGDHGICVETSETPVGYICVCEAGYVEDTIGCRLPRTCLELLGGQPGSADGLHIIDPDLDGPGQPFETRCDMSTDGGGWTLVQRTVWDYAQSGLLRTDYATFQGALLGTAAPGAAFRVPAATWPSLQQTNEHLMREVPRRASDGGDCGSLYYKATGGIWAVPAGGGATLTGVTDPNALFNGTNAISTLDDGPSQTLCVNNNVAVPWFYTTCCTTCPTYRGGYWTDEAHPMSAQMHTRDLLNETMYTRCAPELPRQSDNGSAYYGINVMEYYLR